MQVMDLCDEAGLDMGEADYTLLLEAAAAGASWQQVQRVLTRMGQELTVLQVSTLRAAEAYFRYANILLHGCLLWDLFAKPPVVPCFVLPMITTCATCG